jgi:CheY-like chemotaxis protein
LQDPAHERKLIGLLKAEERTRSIPVIAVTSFAMAGDRERLLEVGFVDYLSKPIDTEAMQQAITRHLGIDRGSDD